MTTFQKIRELLAARLEIAEADVTPERTLESLALDSLATLELLFDIEEAFGIRISQDHRGLATLGDVVALVEREIGRQCAAAA